MWTRLVRYPLQQHHYPTARRQAIDHHHHRFPRSATRSRLRQNDTSPPHYRRRCRQLPLRYQVKKHEKKQHFSVEMRRFVSKQLCQALLAAAGSPSYVYWNALSSASKRTISTATGLCNLLTNLSNSSLLSKGLLASPWSVFQLRGSKVLGSEVRPGNVIHRKGRVYQVLKAQHTQHGRGGASIQVELRDVDGGNKVTEKFRTDEAIERVYVEDKTFTYLYTEGDTIVLMDSDSYEQVEVPKELFGKPAIYLKDDMKVTVQYYDERPMSASVPQRVTCTVMEAQTPMKGLSATQQYKRVVLDNGLTVLAPPFIVIGDAIVINTADDSYMTRAKE